MNLDKNKITISYNYFFNKGVITGNDYNKLTNFMFNETIRLKDLIDILNKIYDYSQKDINVIFDGADLYFDGAFEDDNSYLNRLKNMIKYREKQINKLLNNDDMESKYKIDKYKLEIKYIKEKIAEVEKHNDR